MEEFKVAHIQEQGQDMVIVLVNSSFGRKADTDQADITAWLQECASCAGLAGVAVPVWDAGQGRMGFRAPNSWHPFFMSVNLGQIAKSVNKTLHCPL